MLPSSGSEAPNMVDPLDRVIFSHWAPYKRTTCEDLRLRMRKELCYIEISKLRLYRES